MFWYASVKADVSWSVNKKPKSNKLSKVWQQQQLFRQNHHILFVCTFKVWNLKLYTIMIHYMLLDFKDGRYKLKYDRMNLAIFIEALKEVFCIFRIWNCIWESCHPVLCPIQCETHLLLVRLERDLFNLAEKLPSLKRKNVHTSFCLKEFILQTFRTEWFIMRYNCR